VNLGLPNSTASTGPTHFRIVRMRNAHPAIGKPEPLRMVSLRINICSALEYIPVLIYRLFNRHAMSWFDGVSQTLTPPDGALRRNLLIWNPCLL
jgi:hypothetical protein